jgi:hypothetical protein
MPNALTIAALAFALLIAVAAALLVHASVLIRPTTREGAKRPLSALPSAGTSID